MLMKTLAYHGLEEKKHLHYGGNSECCVADSSGFYVFPSLDAFVSYRTLAFYSSTFSACFFLDLEIEIAVVGKSAESARVVYVVHYVDTLQGEVLYLLFGVEGRAIVAQLCHALRKTRLASNQENSLYSHLPVPSATDSET